MLKKIDLEEIVNSQIEFDEFLASLKQISMKYKEETVIYNAWTKEPNPLSPKGCKISRKMPHNAKVTDLCKIIIDELKILKDHLHRAHMKFGAFKNAREKAAVSSSSITMHIDWNENAKLRQAREQKSAYYNETQVSIHCVHIWYGEDGYSIVSMSDYTGHHVSAAIVSLDLVLGIINSLYFMKANKVLSNFSSSSP